MKATEILSKAKELLSIETETEEVKLAQATLENGTVIEAEEMTAGKEVFIVTEDEKVALPVGKYSLEDGTELVVEEEGMIASIGEPQQEEEEASAEEELAEEQEMEYATKQELSEIREMVEEIKAMIKDKEEMSKEESVDEVVENIVEEVKEELSAETEVEKVKHNPEATAKRELNLYAQNRTMSAYDRVLSKITKINK
jgi:hypothetical protein